MTRKTVLIACAFVAATAAAADSAIYAERQFTFPDGRTKALVLSYDDGPAQDIRFIELLNQYGLKGTFNINSGRLGQKAEWMTEFIGHPGWYVKAEQLAELYAGHEVASHTVNHPHLVDLDSPSIHDEVARDISLLEQLGGARVESFAYPFGELDDRIVAVLAKTGITNARTVESAGDFGLPDAFLRWHPTAHHTQALQLVDDFLSIDTDDPLVFVLWGHSWEFDKNIPDNNWDVAEALCKRLGGHNDIWYVGAGEFARYIQTVKNVRRVGNEWVNESDVPIWVRVDGKPQELPAR